MNNHEIVKKINEAEMVLVGLGEEFNDSKRLKECSEYLRGRDLLQEAGYNWLLPAWNEYCSEKLGENFMKQALENLTALLKDKNYFIVATATDKCVAEIEWKQNRLVMPCGSARVKQCAKGCEKILEETDAADKRFLQECFDKLYQGVFPVDVLRLGKCPECGADMILNNVFAENYNERGYMENWQTYTKWLQGTVNRRLVVLELGVSMRFPSVIRWPFEKIAFFNNKATFIRVNETLYQLAEELAGKGCGIPQNAIEWLRILC